MGESRTGLFIRAARLAPSIVLALVVLTLDLATLYPDVLANGDSAKFQYLGHVLGTAHPPGYPLYVLVSHLFSYVPLGTLAWRINLMSALAGTGAVLCAYGAARCLGARSLHAATLAAALAVGRMFWEESLGAEVYTLNALLIAAALWRVLAWSRTRRDRDLLTSIGLLSLGLGNHLTIATVAPAFVLFVLATDWRRAVRPRILLAGAGLILLGLAQYLFIILRTWQHAPYLEARASNLPELFDVMRAHKYSGDMFVFTWKALLSERLPGIGHMLRDELSSAGVALVALGIAVGLWRRWRETLLLVLTAAGVLLLSANIRADTEGFLIGALVPLWLLGAFVPGMSEGWPRTGHRACAVASLVGVAGLAVTLAVSNFRLVDHSDRTFNRRFYSAVLDRVPNGSRIVAESYTLDQGLLYFLAGEDVTTTRDITIAPREQPVIDQAFRDGRTVVAFAQGVQALQQYGFDFEPMPLEDWTVDRLLGSRRDRFVIAAIQPDAIPLLAAQAPDFLRGLGGTWRPSSTASRYAIVGVTGGAAGVPEATAGVVDLQVPAGARIGRRILPRSAHVHVEPGSIAIDVDGAEVLRTDAALAVVSLDSAGQVRQRLTPARSNSLKPAIGPPLAWRMVGSVRCEEVGDRVWHDVTSIAAAGLVIRTDNYRAYDSRAVLYLVADQPLQVRLTRTSGPAPKVDIALIPPQARAARLAADGMAAAPALLNAPQLVRLAQQVNDGGDQASSVFDLGAVPRALWALGEADRVAAPRVRVCGRVTARSGTAGP